MTERGVNKPSSLGTMSGHWRLRQGSDMVRFYVPSSSLGFCICRFWICEFASLLKSTLVALSWLFVDMYREVKSESPSAHVPFGTFALCPPPAVAFGGLLASSKKRPV